VIVSDLGKVLLPFDIERAWGALLPHFGVPVETARDTFRQVHSGCRPGVGGSTGAEFHRRLTEQMGLALTYEAFCVAWSDMFWEDEAVLELIARAPVEARYLLSNTNEIHWNFIRERYPHVLSRSTAW
jgi:glucose-1-phosphatase